MRNYRILLRGTITTIVTLIIFSLFSYARNSGVPESESVLSATENTLPDIFEPNKTEPEGKSSANALPDFATLAKKVSPAVVNIRTLVKPKRVANPFNDPNNPFGELFRHFYEQQDPSKRSAPKQEKPVPKYLGSGFILSKDGYILTNAHVIKDADEIMVKLIDRREFKAKLIGKDEKTDLALLKIDAKNLPVLKLGDTSGLKQGQWVMAIGSPYGLDYTVTKGIISALNRSLSNTSYVPFIQTDVPINPGNSGGPLIDLQGNAIGVNSQIVTTSGGFMGLSFAIPGDEAAYVVGQLKEHGKVERGWLGVNFQDIDQNLATSFKLTHPEGALISRVISDSPAAKAGFKTGDIILTFNSQKIVYFSDLPAIVGRIPVGTKTKAEVWRDGKLISIEVTIEKPDNDRTSATGEKISRFLGVHAVELTDQWRQNLNTRDDHQTTGVVIDLTPDNNTIAAQWGLKYGDIITKLDGTTITNKKTFDEVEDRLVKKKKEVEDHKSNMVNVQIMITRRGNAIYQAFPITDLNKGDEKSSADK